jgi:acid stress-induced BolA-like protein IbaG/YrbA
MAFKDELLTALSEPESGLEAPRLDIGDNPDDKIAGFLISNTFRGMPQLDRQNLVWNYLEKRLQPEQLDKIVTLVTLTPLEAEAD